MEKAILVAVCTQNSFDFDENIEEMKNLAYACEIEVDNVITQNLPSINKKFYVNSGKIEEVRALALDKEIDILLFNTSLSPSQLRNIENFTGCSVYDKSDLILQIFSKRAKSKEAKLQVTESERIAKVEMQVINNYNNNINDIKILGRTLATGTTKIESTESLNNTFDAPMLSAINTNDIANAIVYYSENGAATADLQNVENAWTTDITDFSRVKSYLIVLTDYQMARGDVINFSYDVKIPENLEFCSVGCEFTKIIQL